MKYFRPNLSFIVFVLPSITNLLSYAQETDVNYKVTYVASEGFIVESGNKKIAIDAFPSRRFLYRQKVSKAIVDSMENANAPFNNIDIMFVTHLHLDHFDPDLTIQHLESDTLTQLVCTKQVYDIIKLLGGYYRVEDRIHPIQVDSGQSFITTINNIQFKAMHTNHGPYFVKDTITGQKYNRHKNVNHIAYLIHLNGVNIMHTGDSHLRSKDEYAQYNLAKDSVDLLFTESLFWGKKLFDSRYDIVNNLISPNHIVIMHLQMGDDLSWVSQEMKDAYPTLVFFNEPLQTRIFKK